MSAKDKLELDFSVMHLRCTVDSRDKSMQDIFSSEFRFEGGDWKLRYSYFPNDACQYNLLLSWCSGVKPNPLHVSVQVESAEKDRIVRVLSEEKSFTFEFKDSYQFIWEKSESEIVASLPEFRLSGVLKLLVVLKLEGSDSRETQTEFSAPAVAEPSCSTRSISAQNTLLPKAILCLQRLSEDFAKLMVEDSQHDVEFDCAGQSIKAHKMIVCRRSPVIASMLSSDMVEGRTGVVKIPDIEPDVFRHLLVYIYSGRLPDLTVDLAINLYESGDKYGVLGLARRCSEYLVEHLSAENTCRLLVVADAHSGEDFRESVIVFMLDNEIPLSGGDWRDFTDAHPKLAIEVLNRFCLKLKKRESTVYVPPQIVQIYGKPYKGRRRFDR